MIDKRRINNIVLELFLDLHSQKIRPPYNVGYSKSPKIDIFGDSGGLL